MYTEQIQQYHAKLTQQRIDGKIQNNELVWCKGIATLRAFIDGKCHSVNMRKDIDNTAAIAKMNGILGKEMKSIKSKGSKDANNANNIQSQE